MLGRTDVDDDSEHVEDQHVAQGEVLASPDVSKVSLPTGDVNKAAHHLDYQRESEDLKENDVALRMPQGDLD